MTTLPRALTSTEQDLLRRDNCSTRLYLVIHQPATVFTARLAAVPPSTDGLLSITYNTGVGDQTKILADQTMYVGTTAGAYDLGMVRIRNLTGIGAVTGTFNIDEQSAVNWQANCYLTVVDEFNIWRRNVRLTGITPFIDEIPYTDQHSKCDSIPIMGCHRVLLLKGSTVSTTFDWSDSWALNNTITGFVCAAPGASATSGLTTSTPTITYNALGTYRVSCTVTNSDGKSYTGYRYVFVTTEEACLNQFTVNSLEGSWQNGGWKAVVTLYDQASLALVRDRALCILFAVDYYGNTRRSLGFIPGAENIVFCGWISREDITSARRGLSGYVKFTIETPNYWLNMITAFPTGMKDRTIPPDKWSKFQNLTPKAAIWSQWHWRSTVDRCTDVFPLENTTRTARIEAPGAQTLWEQTRTEEWNYTRSLPVCDHYGRLFNELDQQLLNSTQRSAVPVIDSLGEDDWEGDALNYERVTVSPNSLTDLSGASWTGSATTALGALSPGRVSRNYGKPDVVDRLTLPDLPTTIALCGAWAGWKNNPFPRIPFNSPANNRFMDIAPYMYWNLTVDPSRNPRGIGFSGRVFPRSVRYDFAEGGNFLTIGAELEAESFPALAVEHQQPTIIVPPVIPPLPPPPPPIVPPPIISTAREVWVFTTTNVFWASDFFAGGQPTWNKVAGAMPQVGTPAAGLVASDGSAIYLIYPQGANAGIYRCTNPKDATPIWTDILVGQTSGPFPYELIHGNAQVGMQDNLFWCSARAAGEDTFYGYHLGSYNGTSWTWSAANWNSGDWRWAYSWFNKKNYWLSCGGGSNIGTFWTVPHGSGTPPVVNNFAGYYANGNDASQIWSWSSSSAVSLVRLVASPFTVYMCLPYAGTVLTAITGATLTSGNINGAVYGSLTGNKVFIIAGSGDMWIGDATGVVLKTTWGGVTWIGDAARSGGGALVAGLRSCLANNEFIRISADGTGDATSWTAMTGNFWSITSGGKTFVGFGMVYI